MRLSRKPPPTTMRSVSRQPLRRRKRRITVASSWAKSSIAPWMTPAASGSPSTRSLSSFFLLISSARRLAERVLADLPQPLAPIIEDRPEGAVARAVADEALLVAQLDIVAVDDDGRQVIGPVRDSGGDGG